MANTDYPAGFTPVSLIGGGDYRGKLVPVIFASGDAVACFIGDLVALTGTADATGKYQTVAQGTAGAAAYGVLVSLEPDFANESFTTLYREASTVRTGYVAAGPDVLYAIQEDSDGGAIAAASAGLNCDVIVGSGDTITGRSAMELDSNTAAATATLNVRLHSVRRKVGNDIGTNAEWLVSINNQQLDLNDTGA